MSPFLRRLSVVLAATLACGSLSAEPRDEGGEVPDDTSVHPQAQRLEFSVRGAGAVGQNESFALVGLGASYRIAPSLSLGAYADTTVASFAVGEACELDQGCSDGFQRVGARGVLHMLPDFVIDPWLGAGLGFAHLDEPTHGDALRGDFTLEVGVDVRPASWLAFGPYVMVARALEAQSDYDGFAGAGVRLSISLPATSAQRTVARTSWR